MNKEQRVRQLKETIETCQNQIGKLKSEIEEEKRQPELKPGMVVEYGHGPRRIVEDYTGCESLWKYTDLTLGYVFLSRPEGKSPGDLFPYCKVLANSLEEYYRKKFKEECESVSVRESFPPQFEIGIYYKL